jgi:hypothetical protein
MRFGYRTLPLLLMSVTAACYDQVLVPDHESDGRISIINDEAELDARVSYPHQNVPISPPPAASGAAASSPAMAPSSINLSGPS